MPPFALAAGAEGVSADGGEPAVAWAPSGPLESDPTPTAAITLPAAAEATARQAQR